MRNIILDYAWAKNPKQPLVSYDNLCDNLEAKKLIDQLTEPRKLEFFSRWGDEVMK